MPRPTRISIPRRAVPVMKWLSELSHESFDQLVSALPDADTAVSQSQLVGRLQEAIPDENPDDVATLITEVLSLLMLQTEHQWDARETVTAIATDSDLELDPDEVSAFADRLFAISTNPTLLLLAKAYDIAGEYQFLIHKSRIVNDIRPIHESGPGSAVVGAVVTHTLKIEYHALGGRKEIYLALSDADLEELAEIAEQAKQGSRTLEAFIKSANIQDLSSALE